MNRKVDLWNTVVVTDSSKFWGITSKVDQDKIESMLSIFFSFFIEMFKKKEEGSYM